MKKSKLFKTLLIPSLGIISLGSIATSVTSCGGTEVDGLNQSYITNIKYTYYEKEYYWGNALLEFELWCEYCDNIAEMKIQQSDAFIPDYHRIDDISYLIHMRKCKFFLSAKIHSKEYIDSKKLFQCTGQCICLFANNAKCSFIYDIKISVKDSKLIGYKISNII